MTRKDAFITAKEKSVLYDEIFCIIEKGGVYSVCVDRLIKDDTIIYKSFFGGEEIIF